MKTYLNKYSIPACWYILIFTAIWLGFPNNLLDCPLLALFWPIGLCALGQWAKNWRQAIIHGWLASALGCFAALYWLALPITQVGELPLPLAILCAALIAFALASQGGLFSALSHALNSSPPVFPLLLLPLFWYLLEFVYAHVAGFPWLPLAGALITWPSLTQLADIAGAYLTGALWVFIAIAFFYAVKGTIPRLTGLVITAASAILLAAYGYWQLQAAPLTSWPESEDSFAAMLVEGNIDQNQKWIPAFQKESMEIYLNLTRRGLMEARKTGIKPDIIIWPETAMPFFFQNAPQYAAQIRSAVDTWQLPLLFGAPGLNGNIGDEVVFNRAFLLTPDDNKIAYYDKMHLVPFGEYVPSWLKLDFLEALLQGVGIYQEGTDPSPLRCGNLALGMLICYEGIFPWLAQERVQAGANILVDISNDGWFGTTPAARQHLYLTALRCLEQGRWLLRSTNTGISASIDTRGRITRSGGMFEAGYLFFRAKIEYGHTIFYYACAWYPWLAAIFFCGLLWASPVKLNGLRIRVK